MIPENETVFETTSPGTDLETAARNHLSIAITTHLNAILEGIHNTELTDTAFNKLNASIWDALSNVVALDADAETFQAAMRILERDRVLYESLIEGRIRTACTIVHG